jgi:hypothetical protein
MHLESTSGSAAFTCSRHLLGPAGNATGRGPEINDESPTQLQAQLSSIMAENKELRAQLEQLRADRTRIAEILNRLTEVVGSKSPDNLVHDIRNVLNERALYRALAEPVM